MILLELVALVNGCILSVLLNSDKDNRVYKEEAFLGEVIDCKVTIISQISTNIKSDLITKVNVKNERRFDRPTVIFKFKVRSKIELACAYIPL